MANSPTANTHKRCRMHNTHGFMPKTYWEIKEPQAANMERMTKNKTVLRKKFITENLSDGLDAKQPINNVYFNTKRICFFWFDGFCVCLLMLRNHKYRNKKEFRIEKAV